MDGFVRKKRSNSCRRRRPSSSSRAPPGHHDVDSSSSSSSSRNTIAGGDQITSNSKLQISDQHQQQQQPRKVKLKVGGVTLGTIHHAKPSSRPKLILQENSDDDQFAPPGVPAGLHERPWKDFPKGDYRFGNKDAISTPMIPEESISQKQTYKNEPTRKSKRVPKPRLFSDGDDDEEIGYLGRFKTTKFSSDHTAEVEDDESGGKKKRRISTLSKSKLSDGGYEHDVSYGSSRSGREGKNKSRSEKIAEDTDYEGEEQLPSDIECEIQRKMQKKEFVVTLMEGKKEMSLTTRQRALQSGKDSTTGIGGSLIEFPDGLPPAPSRKQKEKLSEVEQQLKKAEAAQRRRMQVEKAARESEAEAIRKILGQDSSRKKREDKMKKRRDEIAQEKAANAMTLPKNTIRWVIGPTETVVTFPEEIGLPSIFSSKPCSYPPPREKCAGPSCTNAYKYRDSKSKLPLCSLHCYKAVNDQMQPVSSC